MCTYYKCYIKYTHMCVVAFHCLKTRISVEKKEKKEKMT